MQTQLPHTTYPIQPHIPRTTPHVQADALQIEMQPVEEPPVEPLAGPIDQGERIDESEMERLKKGLEDLYNLF